MRAVITVVGNDTVGILSKVSGICAEYNINVEDVTQSILQGVFAMIMMVDMSHCAVDIPTLKKSFEKAQEEMGVEIRLTRTEVFDAMHRI
ncbi:ACT domain-containing protein [Sinanaerobacter sp. ZZT-01]|uniref:ACT domain-containing protein n=1 Tax=Sinanaerobacter sp. ZZT-01 TaxID=3111540 RepID=UPI002D77E06E|nr:ACT domain-containing protein [Sinanaerobacter sp. ZZT-01]WRR93522.1 ACT domain-containing protein [Sinanaerobacter sp. ZZT-01]